MGHTVVEIFQGGMFHPEANAGPKDSELLFDEFMNMIGGNK